MKKMLKFDQMLPRVKSSISCATTTPAKLDVKCKENEFNFTECGKCYIFGNN